MIFVVYRMQFIKLFSSILPKTWLMVATLSGQCLGVSDQVLSSDLMTYLFRNYSASLIPICTPETGVRLTVNVALRQIINLNEKEQILSSYVWVRLSWEDCRLSWDPVDYNNITLITVPFDEVWVPDISLYDNAAEGEMLPGMSGFSAQVYNSSTVKYNFPVKIKTACKVNVRYFPFDTQTCTLKFGSWSHHGFHLDIVSGTLDMNAFNENSEWVINEVPIERHVTYYNCCPEPYPDIRYYVKMSRRPNFYLVNLVFPCALMAFIAALTFMLPVESGEKVSLEVTVLLSLAVYMLVVTDLMPPSSDNFPLMGIYFAVSMALITMSCLQTVVVLNFFYRGTDGRKVPEWAKRNILGKLGQILDPKKTDRFKKAKIYLHHDKNETTVLEGSQENARCYKLTMSGAQDYVKEDRLQDDTNDNNIRNVGILPDLQPSMFAPAVKVAEEQAKLLKSLSGFVDEKKNEDKITGDWRDLANILDRLFLLVYIILTAVITIVFILMYYLH